MIAKKTTQSDFDKMVAYVSPKNPKIIDENDLTTGEVVSLWWITNRYHGKKTYIPKYFKQVYSVDISKQLLLFKKFGYIEAEDEDYKLTAKGQAIISKYSWVIEEHKKGGRAEFYGGRQILSQKDISQQVEKASAYRMSQNDILPNEFISLDIETTGLYPDEGDVITQLTATHVVNGVETEYFDTYVATDLRIDSFISNLTGIDSEVLRDAPNLDQIKNEFQEFIQNLPIIGWNIKKFDVPFLQKYGIDITDHKVIDLMYVARRYKHPGVNNKLTTLKLMTGVKSIAHNSLAYARATVLVGSKLAMFDYSDTAVVGGGPKSSLLGFKYEDTTPIFESLVFAFTGSIEDGKYSRKQMEFIVKQHGGKITSSISKRVNYFIQGVQVATDGKRSAKEMKYQKLCDEGVDIYKTNGRGFDKLLDSYKKYALY